MSETAKALRSEVEQAVLEAVAGLGESAVDRATIVKQFLGRGASRSTLFAWVGQCLASGKPGQAVAKRVKAAAAERAARLPDQAQAAEEVGREAAMHLPVRAGADDVFAAAAPSVPALVGPDAVPRRRLPILEKLADVIANAELVIAHAKTEDGKPRNAKLLLMAGESLRRCAETALRISKEMHDLDRLDQFHREILDAVVAVAKKRPEVGEELINAMRAVDARWMPQDEPRGR